MDIKKELKNVKFTWCELDKYLMITDKSETVILSRIEMFSLQRFITRIAQKHWHKKNEKKDK